jgi:hypothetical protein
MKSGRRARLPCEFIDPGLKLRPKRERNVPMTHPHQNQRPNKTQQPRQSPSRQNQSRPNQSRSAHQPSAQPRSTQQRPVSPGPLIPGLANPGPPQQRSAQHGEANSGPGHQGTEYQGLAPRELAHHNQSHQEAPPHRERDEAVAALGSRLERLRALGRLTTDPRSLEAIRHEIAALSSWERAPGTPRGERGASR